MPRSVTDKSLYSYYINHYTKSTSWEDPRERYQQIGKAGNVRDESKVAVEQFQLQVSAGLVGSCNRPAQPASLAPLANQQVASMRRELEAEGFGQVENVSIPHKQEETYITQTLV